MMDFLLSQFAFLGNFHPVMVHFPLALLPVALLLKLTGRVYLQDAADLLLKLVLLTAVLAASMGFIYSRANGFSGEGLTSHAQMAWLSIALLALAVLLPKQRPDSAILDMLEFVLVPCGRFLFRLARILLTILKYSILLVLFPVWLFYLLVRKIYRRFFASTLSPRLEKIRCFINLKWGSFCSLLKLLSSKIFTLKNTKQAASVLALLVIFITGYRGSNLVHGEGHLAQHAPEWLQPVLGGQQQIDLSTKLDEAYFQQHIQPVLQKNCVKCHGADKQKANLQLHQFTTISQAGVIEFKAPYNSKIIKRVLLSRDDPLAMPPVKNGKALKGEDIALLVDWINGRTMEAQAGDEVVNQLSPTYLAIDQKLEPLSKQQLSFAIDGLNLSLLSEDTGLLAANLQFVAPDQIDLAWQKLQPLKSHIVHLDVSQRILTSKEQQQIASLPNLVKLNLANTQLKDASFLHNQKHLRWLNVYGNTLPSTQLSSLKQREDLQILP